MLSIGGTHFALAAGNGKIFPRAVPEYRNFIHTGGESCVDTVHVELQVGEVGVPAGGRPLVEAGDSWTLYEHGGKLFMSPRPDSEGVAPPWEAEIDLRRRSVRVLCGREMLVDHEGVSSLWNPFYYPLDQVVMMLLLAGEGAIVHACGLDINGRGVVLAGPSRAGKTTISRLCAAAGISVLSDDRVIVRRVGGEFRIFGTPWPGEGGYAVNRSVPLAALVFLTKGDSTRLELIAPALATRRLLPVISLPRFDPALAGRALDLCHDLVSRYPAHELIFRPDASAVAALREAFP